jgi:hypothetical protein
VQILPNIPLTILQLSFGCVKRNLDSPDNRTRVGAVPRMMLRNITLRHKMPAQWSKIKFIVFRF